MMRTKFLVPFLFSVSTLLMASPSYGGEDEPTASSHPPVHKQTLPDSKDTPSFPTPSSPSLVQGASVGSKDDMAPFRDAVVVHSSTLGMHRITPVSAVLELVKTQLQIERFKRRIQSLTPQHSKGLGPNWYLVCTKMKKMLSRDPLPFLRDDQIRQLEKVKMFSPLKGTLLKGKEYIQAIDCVLDSISPSVDRVVKSQVGLLEAAERQHDRNKQLFKSPDLAQQIITYWDIIQEYAHKVLSADESSEHVRHLLDNTYHDTKVIAQKPRAGKPSASKQLEPYTNDWERAIFTYVTSAFYLEWYKSRRQDPSINPDLFEAELTTYFQIQYEGTRETLRESTYLMGQSLMNWPIITQRVHAFFEDDEPKEKIDKLLQDAHQYVTVAAGQILVASQSVFAQSKIAGPGPLLPTASPASAPQSTTVADSLQKLSALSSSQSSGGTVASSLSPLSLAGPSMSQEFVPVHPLTIAVSSLAGGGEPATQQETSFPTSPMPARSPSPSPLSPTTSEAPSSASSSGEMSVRTIRVTLLPLSPSASAETAPSASAPASDPMPRRSLANTSVPTSNSRFHARSSSAGSLSITTALPHNEPTESSTGSSSVPTSPPQLVSSLVSTTSSGTSSTDGEEDTNGSSSISSLPPQPKPQAQGSSWMAPGLRGVTTLLRVAGDVAGDGLKVLTAPSSAKPPLHSGKIRSL